jgi:hypothetical protein
MMSGDEGFLARWSRRKRRAVSKTQDRPQPAPADQSAVPVPPGEAPPVDPATLPPIETIGAGSDIRAFLAAGVPADLTRAALRRAWSADPTIRDFVGLSENSWDFAAPGGVPGFGSVTQDEVRRLLERLAEEPQAADPAAKTASADRPDVPAAAPGRAPTDRAGSVAACGPTMPGQENAAPQHDGARRESLAPLQHRAHGGALPK